MESTTQQISVDKIDIPQDARTHDPAKLESLMQDMKDQGQIQAIVVNPKEDRFEVVVGVGRVLAARKLSWTQIKAEVREGLSDFDKAHLTFSENEEREDADPFYQASQLQKMMKAQNIDQKTLAVKLNSDEGGISRSLGLLDLEPDVQQELQRCNFPQGHLTQIVRLQKAVDQLQVAKTCQAQDLSVRQLKALVDKKLSEGGVTKTKSGNGNGKHAVVKQFMANSGFKFTQKGANVEINASWDRTSDLDSFLAKLRGVLLIWISQHPGQVSEKDTTADNNQMSATN